MSAEARVLGATIVLAALLTGLAWWLSQQRAPRTHEATHAPSTEPAPWLVWASPPITSRDASATTDASTVHDDAGPSTEARDRLGALLVAQICARRDECLCGAYPSPYAEGHETATTCEADVLRDFQRWWSEQVTTPVVLVEEAALLAAVDASVGCTGTRARIDELVRADALDGEPCGSAYQCRDESLCIQGMCVGFARAGATCTDEDEWEPRERQCVEGLRCVRGRCVDGLSEGDRCDVDSTDCALGLACLDERCERLLMEGEPCEADRDVCDDGLECVEGRCIDEEPPRITCERPTLRRSIGQHRSDDPYPPEECIPFGSPCRHGSDCGWGWCEGAGSWRCDEPAPHASLDEPQWGSSGTPVCLPGARCEGYDGPCHCPPGSSCRGSAGPGGGLCVRDAARGEDCRHAECTAGLDCDYQVPEGGRCVGYLCMQTRFFS